MIDNSIESLINDEITNTLRKIRQNSEARVERTREMWCPMCGSLSGFINRQQLMIGAVYENVTFQRIAGENGSRGTCPCCSKGISAGLNPDAFTERMAAFGIVVRYDHVTGAELE